MSLSHYRRRNHIHSLFDDFDMLFRNQLMVPWGSHTNSLDTRPTQARLNMKESETSYTYELELPGVPKEGLKVTQDGNTVTVLSFSSLIFAYNKLQLSKLNW